jgi:hypothetical protein
VHVRGSESLLDDLLPLFDVRQVHEAWLPAPADVVYSAVKQARWTISARVASVCSVLRVAVRARWDPFWILAHFGAAPSAQPWKLRARRIRDRDSVLIT